MVELKTILACLVLEVDWKVPLGKELQQWVPSPDMTPRNKEKLWLEFRRTQPM